MKTLGGVGGVHSGEKHTSDLPGSQLQSLWEFLEKAREASHFGPMWDWIMQASPLLKGQGELGDVENPGLPQPRESSPQLSGGSFLH